MTRAPLAIVFVLAACEGARQDMYDQPRYKPMAASALFADGSSARPPPAGTVPHARGAFADSSSGRAGTAAVIDDETAEAAETMPYPVTPALLQRGQNRYAIYCLPCHSPVGDGDGLVVRHGFPAPPSYHSERLRAAADRHFYDVITHGYGVMLPYASRLEPSERWAVVAYLRALQLSQHVQVETLPPAERARLVKEATP